MRAVAAALALLFVLLAGAPHVHTAWAGSEECAVCVARHADAPRAVLPDVAALAGAPAGDVAPEPGLAPVSGAPLGAIPGQSPPAAS